MGTHVKVLGALQIALGTIGLQHHGSKKDGVWVGPPSLVQFKNISIKALP